MQQLKVSIKYINFIKQQLEGFKSNPFLDSGGVATIGYGTTIYPNGDKVTMEDKQINEVEASNYLMLAIKSCENFVNSCFNFSTKAWGSSIFLKQNVFDALVDLTYNVGENNVKFIAHTGQQTQLLLKFNRGDLFGAHDELLNGWDTTINGKYCVGLKNRRLAEYKMWGGQY